MRADVTDPSDADVDHPSARVDADLMSTTGVPSNTSIGPILTRVPSISRTIGSPIPNSYFLIFTFFCTFRSLPRRLFPMLQCRTNKANRFECVRAHLKMNYSGRVIKGKLHRIVQAQQLRLIT
jgi:hypothetical protein